MCIIIVPDVCVDTHTTAYIHRSESNPPESVLPSTFGWVPGMELRSPSQHSYRLHPLSHLADSHTSFLNIVLVRTGCYDTSPQAGLPTSPYVFLTILEALKSRASSALVRAHIQAHLLEELKELSRSLCWGH